jgi:hypothetical protein
MATYLCLRVANRSWNCETVLTGDLTMTHFTRTARDTLGTFQIEPPLPPPPPECSQGCSSALAWQ